MKKIFNHDGRIEFRSNGENEARSFEDHLKNSGSIWKRVCLRIGVGVDRRTCKSERNRHETNARRR